MRGPKPLRSGALAAALAAALLAPHAAFALDYRSVAEGGAILYDAPSAQAKKLFAIGAQYPVEVVVSLENFAKVRDATGALAWIEKKRLADGRWVIVTAPHGADVREGPEASARLVFRAAKDVVLEFVEPAPGGWVRVKHADGSAGFVAAGQVWGEEGR